MVVKAMGQWEDQGRVGAGCDDGRLGEDVRCADTRHIIIILYGTVRYSTLEY